MSKNKGRSKSSPKGLDIKLGYVIPALVITVGIIFSVKTFAEQSGESPESNAVSRLDSIYDSFVTLGYGSDSSGSWGDWGTYWNRIKSAGEWTPTGNTTASQVVSGTTFYSDSRTQQTGTYVPQNYVNQHNMDYDDFNCSGNNEETATACAAGDSEYTGEEFSWSLMASGGTPASVTDNGVTQTLTSNKVYKDNLTGVYWSDASVGTMDNEFIYTDGDDRVNPTGASCNFNSDGTANAYCDNQDPTNGLTEDNDVSAAEFCLNLELDRDNADGDNNGLTGVETDWSLPTQKELMQAYIDGSGNNLPNAVIGGLWSSTELYYSRRNVWITMLYHGDTYNNTKETLYYVRCVSRD